jgi:hypothetical protein
MMFFAEFSRTIAGNLQNCCIFTVAACIYFVHLRDWWAYIRYVFLSHVVDWILILNLFCSSLESQYYTMQRLCDYYGASENSFTAFTAGSRDHFQCTVLPHLVL